MKTKFQWFLPTINGDIRLERLSPKQTRLRAWELTAAEARAMEGLRKRALSTRWGRTPWCEEKDFLPITNATYRTVDGLTLNLNAPIEDVQETLAKALKPKRSLLTAIRFSDGRIEEAFEARTAEDGTKTISIPDEPVEKAWDDVHPARVAEAAATVAAPIVGCPMPAFVEAEVRASYVLEHFLTPEQIEDYRKLGCFVSLGHDTGHRYMVIHRERPAMCSKFGGRQLYDLDENRAMCVHDWEVPPPEEMLALHLCLQLPGKERYIRHLPETWHA